MRYYRRPATRDPILPQGDKLCAGMSSIDFDIRSPPASRATSNSGYGRLPRFMCLWLGALWSTADGGNDSALVASPNTSGASETTSSGRRHHGQHQMPPTRMFPSHVTVVPHSGQLGVTHHLPSHTGPSLRAVPPRNARQIVRKVASALSFFSAILPPVSLCQGREVCLSKSLLMSHWV